MKKEYQYTVTVPIAYTALQSWTSQFQRVQEQFFELQLNASEYKDAIAVINRIKIAN